MAAGRARQLLTQPGVIFGFLGILRRQAWVSKTHEVSENALKEITSRDSVGGKKIPPDRTSCFGCAPELWAGGFRAHGVSLPVAQGSDIMRGKEVTGVPSPAHPISVITPPPRMPPPGKLHPRRFEHMRSYTCSASGFPPTGCLLDTRRGAEPAREQDGAAELTIALTHERLTPSTRSSPPSCPRESTSFIQHL